MFTLVHAIIIIILYLTSVKIQINDKINYKSHSLQLGWVYLHRIDIYNSARKYVRIVRDRNSRLISEFCTEYA